jgi:hypothetical protein
VRLPQQYSRYIYCSYLRAVCGCHSRVAGISNPLCASGGYSNTVRKDLVLSTLRVAVVVLGGSWRHRSIVRGDLRSTAGNTRCSRMCLGRGATCGRH